MPGIEAQRMLVPFQRHLVPTHELNEGEYKPSAVLILLCKDQNNNIYFPLIQRFSYKGPHSGQISLPGGKVEPEDINLEHTAIRECYEEIGLSGELEILGRLSPIYIPVSEFLVHPFVAFYSGVVENFVPHEREVEEVLKMYLSHLVDPNNLQRGRIQNIGFTIEAPYFYLEGKQIWGATAMILSELRELLKTIS